MSKMVLPRREVVLPQRQRGFILPGMLGAQKPKPSVDPYFSSVSLNLHLNGTNGGTSFPDNSPLAQTVTANGNAQTSTAQSVFNGSSGLFDGTGDYLSIPYNAALNIRPGDFTIEWRSRIAGNSSANSDGNRHANVLCAGKSGFTANDSWQVGILGDSSTTGTGLYFACHDAGTLRVVIAAFAFSQNTWYACACERTSAGMIFAVDGTTLTNTTDTLTTTTYSGLNNQDTRVGAFDTSGGYVEFLNGYLAELRVTKGVARYGGMSYTPATAAFPNS